MTIKLYCMLYVMKYTLCIQSSVCMFSEYLYCRLILNVVLFIQSVGRIHSSGLVRHSHQPAEHSRFPDPGGRLGCTRSPAHLRWWGRSFERCARPRGASRRSQPGAGGLLLHRDAPSHTEECPAKYRYQHYNRDSYYCSGGE